MHSILIGAVLLLAVVVGVVYVKVFNSPDGERYLKRRMQGPFVPLSEQDEADDQARKAG
ncbi:MAG: hypothetical protein ABIT83_24580 [Massilia sp.]